MPKTTTQSTNPATGTTKRKSAAQPSDPATAPSTTTSKRKSAAKQSETATAQARRQTTERKATTPDPPTPLPLQLVQAWVVEQRLHISSWSENATATGGTCLTKVREASSAEDDDTSEYEIWGLAAVDFPTPEELTTPALSLPAPALLQGIKHALFALGTDASKPVLTGMRFSLNASAVKLLAIDGFRAALVQWPLTGVGRLARTPDEPQCEFTLPGRALKEFVNLLPNEVETVQLQHERNLVQWQWQTVTLTSQLIAEPFPDCEHLFEQFTTFRQVATLERQLLVRSLERLSVLTQRQDKTAVVQLAVERQRLVITIERDSHRGKEIVPCQFAEPDSQEVLVNVAYWLDSLKSLSSAGVELKIARPSGHLIIVPTGKVEHPEWAIAVRYLLAPLQRQSQPQ